MSVSFRTFSLIGGLLVLLNMVALGVDGRLAIGQSVEIFNSAFSEHVRPIAALKKVADAYAVDIVDASHKARNGNQAFAESIKSIERANVTIADAWGKGQGNRNDPRILAGITKVENAKGKADELTFSLLKCLRANDAACLDALVKEQLYQSIDPVSDAVSELIDANMNEVVAHYEENLDLERSSTMIVTILLVVGVVIVLLLQLGYGVYVAGPLAAFKAAVERLAGGDMSVQAPKPGRISDLNRLGDLLNGISANFREGIVLGSALTNSSSNVIIADADRRIIFVNDAFRALFNRMESDLRQRFRNFSVDGLIGRSIDDFHKEPTLIADMIRVMREPIHTQIQLAGRDFKLTAIPVIAKSGERLGTILEWRDFTDQLKAEREVSALVQAASQGDLSSRLVVDGKEGFYRELAVGMNRLVSTVQEAIDEAAAVVHVMADGDLSRRIKYGHGGVFATLKADVNGTMDRLSEFSQNLRSSVEIVRAAASDISAGSEDLAHRTESQAAQLEQSVASMHEVTQTVKQNAGSASMANQLTGAARDTAEQGGAVVVKAVEAMGLIEESSSRIAEIMTLIDEIAFQTNLLALNASVEAARAGEAGKGFAVVAQEVRALAQRSASASKDIKGLISQSGAQVKQGAALVQQTGARLEEIVTAVKRVSDIVGEISGASSEQATALNEVNTAFSAMDTMTQQNAALVEETHAATQSLSNQANLLADLVSFFKTGSGAERRTEQRYDAGPQDFVTVGSQRYPLRNWSNFGMLFGPVTNAPRVGETMHIEVSVAAGGRQLGFRAEIRVVRVEYGYVGVSYRTESVETRAEIERHFRR